MKLLGIASLFLLLSIPLSGFAADMSAIKNQLIPPIQKEYAKIMENMRLPMMEGIKDTDPDKAFVRGMIPHHKGAIDMAKIELKHGKSPEIRKLAQDVIDAQNKEITFMEEWLKNNN